MELSARSAYPHSIYRFDKAFVVLMPSCRHGGYYQRHRPQALCTTISAHGSLAPPGLCCPCHPCYYDPIRQSRRLPQISQMHWLYRGSLPDDLVWAASETFPDLRQRSFHTCHAPYAGRRVGRSSPVLPHPQWPSPVTQWVGSCTLPDNDFRRGLSRRCKLRFMLRPAWLLAFLDRSDLTPRRRPPKTFTPELSPEAITRL